MTLSPLGQSPDVLTRPLRSQNGPFVFLPTHVLAVVGPFPLLPFPCSFPGQSPVLRLTLPDEVALD